MQPRRSCKRTSVLFVCPKKGILLMLNLIPAPRGSVHMQEGSVKLPETVTVSLGDFAPWCLEAFAARLDGHVETAENGFITLKKVDIAKEGYKLTVTKDGITVENAAAAARNDRHVLHAGGDRERYRICPRARHGDHPGNRYAGPHQIDDCGIPAFKLLWRKNRAVPVWRHF